ncbi:ninjurin-1 isoform X2 [Vulpes lagopus]|uniref:ninjurin-1 isoform X2 n=1 Tax=Vulpes lagopus TaxID=494514 RepID=UPI001BCA5E9C|nr:ninjurin-1 isoform X2 [Vulpes lagopus]
MSDQPPGPERTTAPHGWKLTQRLATCPSHAAAGARVTEPQPGPTGGGRNLGCPGPLVAVLTAHEGRFGVDVGGHKARGRSGRAAGSGSGPAEDTSRGVTPWPSCPRGPPQPPGPRPGKGRHRPGLRRRDGALCLPPAPAGRAGGRGRGRRAGPGRAWGRLAVRARPALSQVAPEALALGLLSGLKVSTTGAEPDVQPPARGRGLRGPGRPRGTGRSPPGPAGPPGPGRSRGGAGRGGAGRSRGGAGAGRGGAGAGAQPGAPGPGASGVLAPSEAAPPAAPWSRAPRNTSSTATCARARPAPRRSRWSRKQMAPWAGSALHREPPRWGRNRPINVNHYANKKSAAESMLDIALLMANASQLKAVIEQGPSFTFFVPLVVLIIISLALQIGVGVLLIFLGSGTTSTIPPSTPSWTSLTTWPPA